MIAQTPVNFALKVVFGILTNRVKIKGVLQGGDSEPGKIFSSTPQTHWNQDFNPN